MASIVLGCALRVRALCLLAVLVSAAATQASEDGIAGYLYQTRHTTQPLSAPRAEHAAVKLADGRVGIFGGGALVSVELFDPASEMFTLSKASRWFADFSGVALPDGDALLVDGEHDCTFDFITEQFVDTANKYTGGFTRRPVLVPLPEGRVFICGGCDTDFNPTGTCGLYDPRTRQFSRFGQLQIARYYHTAVLLDERRVLIIGGYGSDGKTGQTLDSLELFDVYTGQSSLVRTALHQARFAHASVKLPDNRVLILGGTHSSAEYWLRSTEIFDPDTSTVTDGPSLALGRREAQVTVLPSGRIAVFGGNYDARATEIYCPDTEVFVLADCLMLDARWSGFTATNLDSGAVLLAGGRVNVDANEPLVQNAEIFEEMATEMPAPPELDPNVVRQLLMDPNKTAVDQTIAWLIRVGPAAKPVLDTLLNDQSFTVRWLVQGILTQIAEYEQIEAWCVEIRDAQGVLDTVWVDGYDAPEHRNPADPHRAVNAVMRATERADFTHLVARFWMYAPYQARVKLFNLVGWTRIPAVVLGSDLDEQSLEGSPIVIAQ